VRSSAGTLVDALSTHSLVFLLHVQTFLNFSPYTDFRERLSPRDFPFLPQDQDYHEHNYMISAGTSYLPKATIQAYYQRGTGVNFVPPADQPPVLASEDIVNLLLSFRPISALKIDNSYLFDRLRDLNSGAAIFNNHIVRSKWNWQFSRQLSLRLILQYTATLANPALTSLESTKQFNGDFLITYLVHPGTAIYVGYNSDLQNLNVVPATPGTTVIPGYVTNTARGYINDSRQLFVKVSYLFRF